MQRSRHLDAELFRGQLIKQSQRAPAYSYARRGAVHYQSSSAKWSRLNSVAAIYDMSGRPGGNSRSEFLEWN